MEQAAQRTEENRRVFKVHPEQERIEEQSSELTRQIHEFANQNVTDGRLLEHYRRSMAVETGAADSERTGWRRRARGCSACLRRRWDRAG